jgi:Glycosyl transferase family 41
MPRQSQICIRIAEGLRAQLPVTLPLPALAMPDDPALRAAPIQINYLGYPGSMGVGFMDYLIADSTVVPRAVQGEYAEKIVYLPRRSTSGSNSPRALERTMQAFRTGY